MRRTWRFRDALNDLLVVRRSEAGADEVARALHPSTAAALLTRMARDNGSLRGRAFPWMYEMSGQLAPSRLPPEPEVLWIAARLDEAVRAGRILVIPLPLPTGGGITVKEPIELEAPPREEPVPEEVAETWIEIELLNSAGEPIPREAFVLTLSDGSVRKGRLNAEGFARVDNIPEGECHVSFPAFDGREWAKK